MIKTKVKKSHDNFPLKGLSLKKKYLHIIVHYQNKENIELKFISLEEISCERYTKLVFLRFVKLLSQNFINFLYLSFRKISLK